MPSLLSGYEYDIFISYRHNDNRSGWVTEFVEALQEELAATIKDPLSIYYDKNPHDGLQQHHEVDDSLREKLKSLILIPIVSQTYCDPKAFAWAHELIPFIQQASVDTLCLKTKVSGGNIASRVLPVQIHDIDNRDKQLFEEATGSAMRTIDFIYKESGVNRPLRPSDDRAHNQQHTDYRNQVNKVANAIKEIITGLTRGKENTEVVEQAPITTGPVTINHPVRKIRKKKIRLPRIPLFNLSLTLIVLAIAFATVALLHFSENKSATQTIRATIVAPENHYFENTFGGNFAISPDGNQLAFVGEDSTHKVRLWVRNLNSLTSQPLNGTDGSSFPFWSPDSKSIGFFANGNLKRIDASGGPVQILCKAEGGRGGSWNQDGVIIYNPSLAPNPLYQVNATGGSTQKLTKLDTTLRQHSHRWPYFLPDGKHFVYCARTATATSGENDGIYLASLDTTFTPRLLVSAGSSVAYANGYLIYSIDRTLMMIPFDLTSFKTTGDAVPFVEGVYFSGLSAKASFSASSNGILLYQTGNSNQTGLSINNRSGTIIKTIERNGSTSIFNEARFSPDEKELVVSLLDTKSGNTDIWIYGIDRGTWTRLTFDPSSQRWPIWSPDGKSIVYSSFENFSFNLYIQAADGSTPKRVLLESDNDLIASHWSSDGKYIVYDVRWGATRNEDLWILPMTGKKETYPFLQTDFDEQLGSFSPDGRWITYQSDESGIDEVYVRPFPGPGGKWQISTNGGAAPRWSGDGKEVYYNVWNRTMSVGVTLGTNSIEIGTTTELLFFNLGAAVPFVEVSRDGQQFIGLNLENTNEAPLSIVINWPEELKKK